MKRQHDQWNPLRELLENGSKEGVFPGAVLLVALGGEIACRHSVGYLSLIPEAVPMEQDTIFDLASLTKPLATTFALMRLADEAKISLDKPLSTFIKTAPLMDKADLTPRLLLSHCGGLVDWKPFYLELANYGLEERKRALREFIIREPFSYVPGEGSLYSDLGFMLLEWLIEETAKMPLHQLVTENFYQPLALKRTFLRNRDSVPPFEKRRFAATEDCPWRKKMMQGEVHDENAYSVGGYSGHAGLFGTVAEVFTLANLLREHYFEMRNDYFNPETVKAFLSRQKIVDDGNFALGWDTPSTQESSSGRYFSPKSVGHLGFTGTSIWMDLEKDVIVILLTNRVHPTRENEKIKAFRPALHDLVMEELGLV